MRLLDQYQNWATRHSNVFTQLSHFVAVLAGMQYTLRLSSCTNRSCVNGSEGDYADPA